MEYKIISGDEEYCQKVLNQWKHQYDIEVISMSAYPGKVIILINRKEKEKRG